MDEGKERTRNLRILVMGDDASEKTKILSCIRKNQCENGDYMSSTDDRVYDKFQLDGIGPVNLEIHNFQRERTHSGYPISKIDIIFIVFSSNNLESFNNIRNWHTDVQRYSRINMPITLIVFHPLNKTTLVTPEQGQAVADELDLTFTQVSENDLDSIQKALILAVKQLPTLKPPPPLVVDKDDELADPNE